MSKRIYISPSSQTANVYAVGDTNEARQCAAIAGALEQALRRRGFTAADGTGGTMYSRAADSNAMKADLHLPIHTNACDGKVAGLRILISRRGGEAEAVAKSIMAALAPITPGTSDGIHVMPELYEIRATAAPCVYVEVGFHDNPVEAAWIIGHTGQIAEAICKGICDHYGVAYAARPVYRVQVGAFYNRDYAEALRQELTDKGYKAFVTEGDSHG